MNNPTNTFRTDTLPVWFQNILAGYVADLLAADWAADIERPYAETLHEAVRRTNADVQAIGQEMVDNPGQFLKFVGVSVHEAANR